VQVTIYEGEGTNGDVIGSGEYTATEPNQFHSCILDALAVVNAGQVYTYRLQAPFANIIWVGLSSNNPYAGGSAYGSPMYDLAFGTYVTESLP